jgi:hypothetical protein
VAWLESPMTQTTTSKVGQTEEDTTEASPAIAVTQHGSASMPSSSSTAGDLVPTEASRRVGPMVPESGEPSRDLTRASSGPEVWGGPWIEWANPQNPRATVFTLDDAVEWSEWRGLHLSLGGVA